MVFGSEAYIHVPKHARKQKLLCRSKKKIFVGIQNGLRRIWDVFSPCAHASKPVVMDEKTFSKNGEAM